MPGPTIEQGAKEGGRQRPSTSIVTGIVLNNCDLLGQGKVLVRIPAIDREVWARLAAIGAGSGTGFFHPPNPDDEVLVALDHNSPTQAYVIGGLWNTIDRPPVDLPVENTFKRTFKTGLPKAGIGHVIEFDDAEQSITIKTSTGQTIAMDPKSITISTTLGASSVKLDLSTQTVSISSLVNIELKAQGEISLTAAKVSINGTIQTDIKGTMVTIN